MDFRVEDAGDGPAFFVLTATSFILIPLALGFHFLTGQHMGLTLLIFGPLIILVSLALLRPLRGMFFAQQISQNAMEATRRDLDR